MSSRFKYAVIIGICLDCILITVFVVWLIYSKSASEFNMLASEMRKKEQMYNHLLEEMNRLQKGLPLEYRGDVVLSVSNMVLDRMGENLFPVEYTLDKGDVSGVIRGEELSDFQFVKGSFIHFRIRIVGKDIVFNPRGSGIINSMLKGMEVRKKVVLDGSGEVSFMFDEEKQRLELRYSIAAIDFKTGFPQFVEKVIKERFAEELHDRPQYIEFDLKPMKVRLGPNTALGHYHVKDVAVSGNRLMAVADLRFERQSGE